MSRTYRRKNATWDMRSYDWDYLENKEGHLFFAQINHSPDSPEYKKEKVKFHRDGKRYGSSVPGWYVNLFHQRPFRQQSKREIQKWMNCPDNHECLPPVYRRSAGYDYW